MLAQPYIFAVAFAVAANDILETGQKIGTANNQWLLGMLVVVLIMIVLYREWQSEKKNKKTDSQHAETLEKMEGTTKELIERIDCDRRNWDDERKARISSLMELVKQVATALEKSASASQSIKEAMDGNKIAIYQLKEAIDRRAI